MRKARLERKKNPLAESEAAEKQRDYQKKFNIMNKVGKFIMNKCWPDKNFQKTIINNRAENQKEDFARLLHGTE